MTTVEKSVEVNVPVSRAYGQWANFEELPRFLEEVEEVRQVEAGRLHCVGEMGGQRQEWDARIAEQIEDQRIAWSSDGDGGAGGAVTFERLDDERTRVTFQLSYSPGEPAGAAGDTIGVTSRVERDLERFKELVEAPVEEPEAAPSRARRLTARGLLIPAAALVGVAAVAVPAFVLIRRRRAARRGLRPEALRQRARDLGPTLKTSAQTMARRLDSRVLQPGRKRLAHLRKR